MANDSAMTSEILHDVMQSLVRLVEETLPETDPPVPVRLSDFSRSRTWGEAGPGVYVATHAVTVNEQGLRGSSPRERVAEQDDGAEVYRFYAPPMPLTLHILLVPCAESAERELKLLGRLYQILQEQPVLSGTQLQGRSIDPETRLTLGPDTQISSEQIQALFTGGGAVPRLAVPCLVRCALRSERVIREARPSRAISGAVRKV